MKVIQTFVNLFFLAGAILVLLFIVLGGATNHAPFNKFYWLRADTSGITGAYDESAWTFWGVCQSDDYTQCLLGPAYPLSPRDNFGTSTGVPSPFLDSRDTYYYLSRFSFAFALLTLAFSGFAFVVDLLGLFFSAVDYVVVILVSIALFFAAGFGALQTSVVILARNAFSGADLHAKVGIQLMALLWTAVVCILIVQVNAIAGTVIESYSSYLKEVKGDPAAVSAVGNDQSSFTRSSPAEVKEEGSGGGIRFFKIKRNNKVSDEESV